MNEDTKQTGFGLQYLVEGDSRTLLSATVANQIIRRVNALSNCKVQRGAKDEFRLSDANAIITIARDALGEGGGGSSVAIYKITSIANIASDYIAAKPVTFDNSNAETLGTEVSVALPWQLRAGRSGKVFPAYAVNDYIIVASSEDGVGVAVSSVQLTLVDLGIGRSMEGTYRGAHDSATEYGIGDMVHTITGSNLVTLLWAAVQSNTNQTPSASSTTYWRLVGVYGNFRRFTVDSGQTNDDYLVCDEANGAANNVNIYKPYKLRGSITSETIAGDTVSYGTYGTDKFSRTATIGGNSEKQVIIPYFLTGDSIFAEYDILGAKWQDLNVDGRAWARKWDQS